MSHDAAAYMQTDADESSDDHSSSDSDEDTSPTMATDIRGPRSMPSGGISGAASPSANQISGTGNPRRSAVQPSSAATLEQNVAFMEMTGRRTSAQSSARTAANFSNNTNNSLATGATSSPVADVLQGRSPSFRSPVVGRRRRRSSADAEDVMVASALLRANGDMVDSGAGGSVEGLLRGSRRRRIGHNDSNDRDLRMEVEPGTPS